MRVLVVNAGSTSVKLRVVEPGDDISHSEDLGPPGEGLDADLERFLQEVGPVDVAGHRVVHGGSELTEPTVIDDHVRSELGRLEELAPLHNPPAVKAIDALRRMAPALPDVACFDTGFHARMPAEASRYALPGEWVRSWNLRRYGFHGLSCAWSTGRAARLLGRRVDDVRLVICHLGGGASVTAVAGGRSVDTTMGFTPTEGLIMATRSGDVDPSLITWLALRALRPEELAEGLEHHSGLLGLSGGVTGDMKELLDLRAAGSEDAHGAIAAYLHRLRAKMAAMASATAGTDAIVFTGGVGERSPAIRAEACTPLGWMGVRLDEGANRAATGGADADISAADSATRVLVVPAREELVVAAACRALLGT